MLQTLIKGDNALFLNMLKVVRKCSILLKKQKLKKKFVENWSKNEKLKIKVSYQNSAMRMRLKKMNKKVKKKKCDFFIRIINRF